MALAVISTLMFCIAFDKNLSKEFKIVVVLSVVFIIVSSSLLGVDAFVFKAQNILTEIVKQKPHEKPSILLDNSVKQSTSLLSNIIP